MRLDFWYLPFLKTFRLVPAVQSFLRLKLAPYVSKKVA